VKEKIIYADERRFDAPFCDGFDSLCASSSQRATINADIPALDGE
jgi:hypothetical protein